MFHKIISSFSVKQLPRQPSSLHFQILSAQLNSLQKNKKRGIFVRANCGPGRGGFLGDVRCFSERNEDLHRSARFSTISAIIVLAVDCSSPSPARTPPWMTSAAEPRCAAALPRGPARQRALASARNCSSPSPNARDRPPTKLVKLRFKLLGRFPGSQHSHPTQAGRRMRPV